MSSCGPDRPQEEVYVESWVALEERESPEDAGREAAQMAAAEEGMCARSLGRCATKLPSRPPAALVPQ